METLQDITSSLLDCLPNELLRMVKTFLEDDLAAAVCFFVLSPRTAAFFDDANDEYWHNLCLKNGIGRTCKDEWGSWEDWKSIALECAAHAWQCRHPACGQARLEENSESFQSYDASYNSTNAI